jgi:hypothetical protein
MKITAALVACLASATLLASGFVARAADDDLKISPKKKPQASALAPKAATPSPAESASGTKAVPAKAAAVPTTASTDGREPQVIRLKIEDGADPRQAWSDYFAAHADVPAADVAQTADSLMHGKKYTQVMALIEEAINHDQAQPWMYSALEIAMEFAGSPKEDLERALMSAVDFSSNIEEVFVVAQYMATHGLEERAMKVFHQTAVLDPGRTESYVLGLKLATRLESASDIKWACLGILSQAWPKREHQVEEVAYRMALATIKELNDDGKTEQADQFRAELDAALVRDCKVVVSWTGDADVDVFIEEPSGTICSYRNPRTTSGGVMLDSGVSRGGKLPAEGFSETYLCPQAFSGQYRILVRRVWGKVTTGKVNIDIYTHAGTKQVEHGRFQLPVGDQDSVGVFDLADGRRQESLDERRLATAVATQTAVNQAVVTQQLNYLSQGSSAGTAVEKSREGLAALPAIQGGVGYQPVIINLPSGANMMAMAVISADRRYVRITPTPFFSSIGQVTTFNIASGRSSSSGSSATSGSGTGGGFGS